MRLHRSKRRGFTLVELMLGLAISTLALSFGIGSYILAQRAIQTGADALILQREADEILNMRLAPEIRVVQTILSAGEGELIYQYLSPTTGTFITNGFVYKDGQFYYCANIPYYGYDEDIQYYVEYLSSQTPDCIALGRFVDDVLFSFRDGGNNLVSMTDGLVDDVSAIEIVDIRLTLGRDRQIYQVSNSFIPIRQFI